MGFLSVLAAALAAWVFGAVWYMINAQRWAEAQGLDENEIDRANPVPYVLSYLFLVLVAGMIRHVLSMSGISSPGGALVAGLGLGAFVAAPWVWMSVLYAGRGAAILWIDGIYAAVGCGLIALVLALM